MSRKLKPRFHRRGRHRLPVEPLRFFWPAGARNSGGNPAGDGETISTVVSHDGQYTANAVGSPVMRHRSYLGGGTRKFIELDGSSGFEMSIGAPFNATPEGIAVAGYRRTAAAGGTKHSILSTSNDTTTTRLLSFFQQEVASSNPGIALDGVIKNGTTTDAQTDIDGESGGRVGAYQNRMWVCDTTYDFHWPGQIATSGAGNNGSFINSGDSFQHNWLTSGFLKRSTGNIFWAEGDISYFGFFDLLNATLRQRLQDFLNKVYPSEYFYFLGDSRCNASEWLEFETENQSRGRAANIHEVATGGNLVSNCQTDWDNDSTIYPDYVVLYVSINNILADQTAATISGQLNTLIDSIVARPRLKQLYVFNETPFGKASSWTSGRQAQLDALRPLIASKCAATEKATLFDSWSVMEDPANPNDLRPADTTDGLHLTTAGYQRLASAFWDQVL